MLGMACSMQYESFNYSNGEDIDIMEGMVSIRSVFAGIDSGVN